MHYTESPPPPVLAPWVRCFWFLTAEGGGPQPVVPDGRLEIVLHRAEPFGEVLGDGSVRTQEAVMVSGQITRPVVLSPRGPADIVGIRFRTAGARDILGLPLAELNDCVIPLYHLAPSLVTALEQAARSDDPVTALTTVLLARVRPTRHRDSGLAVARLAHGMRVDAVARTLGMSTRTLERRVRDDTGLAPKVLQRVMRFRALYALLQAGGGGRGPARPRWPATTTRLTPTAISAHSLAPVRPSTSRSRPNSPRRSCRIRPSRATVSAASWRPMRTLPLLLMAAGLAAQSSPLDQVAWMGGCWQSGGGNRVTLEMWTAPAGGLMVGASRTVAGGQARAFEHLRLRVDGDQVVYTAIPSGQTETDFRSTAISADGFTVENLQHDFPQRIIYRRTGPDAMSARVEGPGPNGPRGFDIAFTRVRCETT